MPCAPIMLDKNLNYFFDKSETDKCIGSDRFMILTYNYKSEIDREIYEGVMHKHPINNQYSGRPQVIESDHHLYSVLEQVEQKLKLKHW